MVDGAWYRASYILSDPTIKNHTSNKTLINFSESPLHLDTTLDAEMLKKVVLHSVATALASMVLPVPGGPYNKIPFQGFKRPVNNLKRNNE